MDYAEIEQPRALLLFSMAVTVFGAGEYLNVGQN
jgi:hypothetical protein